MKHIYSLVVLAGMLAVTGLVTFFIPSLTQGQPGVPPQHPPQQNVTVVNSPSEPVPVTGTISVGNEPVRVTGTINVGNVVQFQPAMPAGAFSSIGFGTSAVVSGPDPEGTRYAITSFTAINHGGDSAVVGVGGAWGTTSNCLAFDGGFFFEGGPTMKVPTGETVHLSFPQPFVLSARPGASSCLKVSSSSPSVGYTVVGYRF